MIKVCINLILTFLIIWGTQGVVFSQEYAPLGAEWHYRSQGGRSYISKIESDTFIENRLCTKMSLYVEDEYVPEADIIFHERHDSIFFYENNAFFLIFDFSENVSIGDTIKYYLPQNINNYVISSTDEAEVSNPYYYVITEIDSVLTQEGEHLKQYHLNPNVSLNSDCNLIYRLVENVGTMGEFFRTGCSFLLVGVPQFCFYLSENRNYVENATCEGTNSTNDLPQEKLLIFPNPVLDYLNFQESNIYFAEIYIYNSRGEIIKRFGEGTERLSVEDLTSGIYFIKILTKQNQVLGDKFYKF